MSLDQQKNGGRPATGSIVWADPATKTQPIGVRVTTAKGRRKLVRFDPGTSPDDARALAPILAKRARNAVEDFAGETVAEYGKRWLAWRALRRLSCARGDRARLALHVFQMIGAVEMQAPAAEMRTHLKRLVASLDAKARDGFSIDANGKRRPFSPKTATNVWATVRAMFRDALRAKEPDLCVREDNPARDVAAPDGSARKAKTYLWPSEFLSLVSCERVPMRWRRLFAVAVYTYTRAGELAALEWGDVDLDHGAIHVHRAKDETRKRTKATKTDEARRIPIEPTLAALLSAMHGGANGQGPVFRVPPAGKLSCKLRLYLKRAGVTRGDLFTSDATRKAITFHDLRATGITWCAVRGDDPLKIMRRAGHAHFSTTEGYLREAENLSAGFGAVFPELPPGLLGGSAPEVSAPVSAFGVSTYAARRKKMANTVGARGFEPPTPRSRTECATRLRYAPFRRHVVAADGDLWRPRRRSSTPSPCRSPRRDPRYPVFRSRCKAPIMRQLQKKSPRPVARASAWC